MAQNITPFPRFGSKATFPGTAQGSSSRGTSLYAAARRVLFFFLADSLYLYNVANCSTPRRNLQPAYPNGAFMRESTSFPQATPLSPSPQCKMKRISWGAKKLKNFIDFSIIPAIMGNVITSCFFMERPCLWMSGSSHNKERRGLCVESEVFGSAIVEWRIWGSIGRKHISIGVEIHPSGYAGIPRALDRSRLSSSGIDF